MKRTIDESIVLRESRRIRASKEERLSVENLSGQLCAAYSRIYMNDSYDLDCQYWSELELLGKLQTWYTTAGVSKTDYLQFLKGSLYLRKNNIGLN